MIMDFNSKDLLSHTEPISQMQRHKYQKRFFLFDEDNYPGCELIVYFQNLGNPQAVNIRR